MARTLKHRLKIYKRFGIDIWGFSIYSPGKLEKITSYFSKKYSERKSYKKTRLKRYNFSFDEILPRRRKSFRRRHFVNKRIFYLFYMTFNYKQVNRLVRKASRRDGLFENNYCLELEGRIMPMVYRSNFLYNMFEIRQYVKRANVFINGMLINFVNFLLKIGDMLTLRRKHVAPLKRIIMHRIKLRRVFFNAPRYMYVNFKLFFTFMETKPFIKDLAFPSKMDLLRTVSYN